MILATIQVDGVSARTIFLKRIPAGIIGGQVRFEFDSRWDDMVKTAVFRGCVTKDVLMDGDVVTIPPEAIAHPIPELQIGIYGVSADGTMAIPTLWASAGRVCYATDPSGDTSTDESLPVWAQIQAEVEKLKQQDGDVDEDTVRQIVEDYLGENPSGPGEKGVGIASITIEEVNENG